MTDGFAYLKQKRDEGRGRGAERKEVDEEQDERIWTRRRGREKGREDVDEERN